MEKVQKKANKEVQHSLKIGDKGEVSQLASITPLMLKKSNANAMAFGSINNSIQKKDNQTGLPNNLKSGIESLSGHSMDDVNVHYNSSQPAQLNAHAFAQGSDIHVASGQEKHLPHEAWHVVQQKQGRVQPTRQMKEKVNINDDEGLEHEADVMGEKALQMKPNETVSQLLSSSYDSLNIQKKSKKKSNDNKYITSYIDPTDLKKMDGKTLASGDAGYSKLMQGNVEDTVKDNIKKGLLKNYMLSTVQANLKGLDRLRDIYTKKEVDWKNKINWTTYPFYKEVLLKNAKKSSNMGAKVDKFGTEFQQKINQFNSFVSIGNNFYISVSRLTVMQQLLGATNNKILAYELDFGLDDIKTQKAKYNNEFESNKRGNATRGELIMPEEKDSVTTSIGRMNLVSRKLDEAYMGFQITVLSGNIGKVKASYAKDEAELKKINEVKAGIKSMATTIDWTIGNMTPTKAIANAKDSLGSISAGGILTTVVDYAYAADIKRIKSKLDEMQVKINGIKSVIDTTKTNQKILKYKNALDAFAIESNSLQGVMKARRNKYRQFGKKLDIFSQSDKGTDKELKVKRGSERYTTIMTIVAVVNEMLTLGELSQNAAPSDLKGWLKSFPKEGVITKYQHKSLQQVLSQMYHFKKDVSITKKIFGEVSKKSTSIMGKY